MTLTAVTAASGFAEKDVIVEHLKYGSEAFELHLADQVNTFDCEGITYRLEDKWFEFQPSTELYGGKTRSVYEYTVPQHVTADYADTTCVLGTVTIVPDVKTTLTVGDGNRMSGVFTLGEPMVLTDVYTEQIVLPCNAQGNPVLIDKIYLYSFEENGETQHYAATFYVDYEGYKASHRGAENNTAQLVAAETQKPQPSVEVTVEPIDETAGEGRENRKLLRQFSPKRVL